ncbi:HNH endonuclease [Bradyrhizobium sp. CCGUVB1N3]|uniref:HNH endonuclease n=1 Tax=Bradyrhizobium sp. CCGUVB1N3 TaxID=2949629 RepID=UPI0020B21761|nr:HNH endonuclease [Bradyrhizobium sp. CCGUVB1N3]MCP3471370.1 HNH endonuclease [Bradyrhizobium sp. CCGUVB1N3]
MKYADYLTSPEWRAKADAVLAREDGNCQRCGDPAREVHHRTYERLFNELLDDLEALCVRCHRLVHGRLSMTDASRQERKQQQYGERRVRDLYAPKGR